MSEPNSQRPLEELVERDDPAWPLIKEWIEESDREIEVLPATEAYRTESLLAAQVTTHSTLGAVLYETGGLFVDHRWLRLFGSGHPDIPRRANLVKMEVEAGGEQATIQTFVIADDVVGGLFGLNSGSFGHNIGDVYYYAPDTHLWENLDLGYSDFIRWCCQGDLDLFYERYRWDGWKEEVRALSGQDGLRFDPPVTTEDFDVQKASREVVPIQELNGKFA